MEGSRMRLMKPEIAYPPRHRPLNQRGKPVANARWLPNRVTRRRRSARPRESSDNVARRCRLIEFFGP